MNGFKAAIGPALRLGAGIFLLISTAPVQAQTRPNPEAMAQVPVTNPETALQESGALLEGEGVMDRARPEYDAIGLPVGGLMLYPTLAASFSADDNIFRGPDGVSDTFWTISPRLDLRSNWSRNALQLYTQLDHYAYDSHGSETRTNWIVGGAGRLDIATGAFANADAYYFDTHESRTSPDLSDLALSPTRYRRAHGDLAATDTINRFTLSATANYDRFDFDPTKLIGGGAIDNGDRDRDVYEVTGKTSYELAPDHAVFAQFTYDNRDFDRLLDRDGFDRNSDGYRLDVGAAMMVTPLIRATAYAGYLKQNYVAPLHDANGLDFNAQIDWFATELLTAHLTASRTIEDTTISGASSMDVRQVSVSADYELLRNLILRGQFGYADDKFDGIARDDKITTTGLEGRYLMNRNLSAYASYDFQRRATNATGRDYKDNIFMIGVRGAY